MRVVRLLRKAARELRELAILPRLPEGEADEVDGILETADNLESYLKVIEWGESYKKRFGRTVVYLVLASKLVLIRTGKAHFNHLSKLLKPILRKSQPDRPALKPDAFRRQVARFNQRYPEIEEELAISPEQNGYILNKKLAEWLTAWNKLETSVVAARSPIPKHADISDCGES